MPTSSAFKMVTLYTDGACIGNPGPGGYGVVLFYADDAGVPHRNELSAGYRKTTNNRMELLAAIRGLEALQGHCRVTLYSDSTYVVNGIEKGWAANWRRSGWKRKGTPVPNWDLWAEMLRLAERHTLTCLWVRGHSGDAENERCDRLARDAAKGTSLPPDPCYENPPSPP